MAFGDLGHRRAGVGQTADQGDALGGEAGVVVAEDFSHHAADRTVDGFAVAGFVGGFRFRIWDQGGVVTLAHQRAVGGITLGGSVAVVGEGRGRESLCFEFAAFVRRQGIDPRLVFAFVFRIAGLLLS